MVRNMPVFIQLVITTHNHVTIAQLSAAGVSWCWRTSLSLSLAYICALQKEVPYHGRLYITDSNLCFFSSVLLKDTKVRNPRSSLSLRTSGAAGLTAHPCVSQVVLPVSSVSFLKKQNTALLVPNAISVRTADGEKVSSCQEHWIMTH